MRERQCLGFHGTEGLCSQMAVDGKYWCIDCDRQRLEHLDRAFKKLAERYGIPDASRA